MTEKKRMLDGLHIVKKQLEAEIASDQHSIRELLRDPSISPPEDDKPVSYAVHKVFHHLAVHKVALEECEVMIHKIEKESPI